MHTNIRSEGLFFRHMIFVYFEKITGQGYILARLYFGAWVATPSAGRAKIYPRPLNFSQLIQLPRVTSFRTLMCSKLQPIFVYISYQVFKIWCDHLGPFIPKTTAASLLRQDANTFHSTFFIKQKCFVRNRHLIQPSWTCCLSTSNPVLDSNAWHAVKELHLVALNVQTMSTFIFTIKI